MSNLFGKLTRASESFKYKLKLKSDESRTVKVTITVDLTKDMYEEDVHVRIKDLQTDHALVQKVLSIDKLRGFVENVVSEKATEVATRLGREKSAQIREKLPLGGGGLV